MAVREFKLPDVGEGLTEAEIVNWLVEVGDEVTEDQPVAEAETDKAVVEVPSPVNGTVKEILADAGEMVPVGDVIITFEVAEGDGTPDSERATGDAAGEAESAAAEAEPATEQAAETGSADAGAGDGAAAGDGAEGAVPEGRVFASPGARRLARELGVDIAQVEGSGPGGRISDADVRAHAESAAESGADEAQEPAPEAGAEAGAGDGAGAEPEAASDRPSATRRKGGAGGHGGAAGSAGGTAAAAQVESADREQTLATPATRKAAEEAGVDLDAVPTDEERDGLPYVTAEQVQAYAEAQQAAQAADAEAVQAGGRAGAGGRTVGGEPAEREERVPFRGIRRTIAEQMSTSKYTAPHVTHHDDVVVEELVEARRTLKAEAEDRGVKLTYMPFVLKAIVAGLKEYPILNSQLDEENEEIVKKHYYNIGIAVATDAGLMVPVVRDVDRKSLLEIQRDINELAEKARTRKISREEMQGGTFTITNFGAIGGKFATPIINYPEAGILGLGAIQEEPVVEDGEVVPRHVLGLSLAIDHRIIDGAEAAAFTETVKRYLKDPTLLLLE